MRPRASIARRVLARAGLALAGCLAGALAGCIGARAGEPWVFEFAAEDPGVGRQRVVLHLAPDDDGARRGGSRYRALSAITGSAFVRAYEWLHPRHGSLVEVTAWEAAEDAPDVVVLDAPTGALVLVGDFQATGFDGRWEGAGFGARAGTFRAWPRASDGPLDDYGAVFDAFAAELEAAFVFPARLATDAFAARRDGARERAATLVDDFEFVGLTAWLGEPLAPSLFCLRDARQPDGTTVDVAWHGDVCVVRCGPIRSGLAELDAAFAEAAAARALVLDLRGCVGYDLTAGRILAHLAPRAEPLGYMLGRKRADAGPLDAATRDALPVITGMYSFALYRRALGLTGVAAGGVAPLEDGAFEGEVCVLIDGFTRAGVEPVAEYLQRSGRATLIGAPTAGAPVDADVVALEDAAGEPLGWTAFIPVGTWVAWDGRWMERAPVVPDVAVASEDALAEALRRLRPTKAPDSL